MVGSPHQMEYWVPIGIRLSLLIGIPFGHFLYHKIIHKVIHISTERLAFLHKLSNKLKFLPDALMMVSLIVLHWIESLGE